MLVEQQTSRTLLGDLWPFVRAVPWGAVSLLALLGILQLALAVPLISPESLQSKRGDHEPLKQMAFMLPISLAFWSFVIWLLWRWLQ